MTLARAWRHLPLIPGLDQAAKPSGRSRQRRTNLLVSDRVIVKDITTPHRHATSRPIVGGARRDETTNRRSYNR
jgi:hypothetical protein